MGSESAPASLLNDQIAGVELTTRFESVMAEVDPGFQQAVSGDQLGYEIQPFAFFTAGDEISDSRRAAMASGTGYTGNNGEESN